MSLTTIVDDYIRAAMRHAFLEPVDGGAIAATVPEAFGVVALGATERDCLNDLHARLEDWVCASLSNGETLPVIGGIDITLADTRALAACHARTSAPMPSEFFENEQEFEAVFTRWGKGG